jgi:hypothetical protein
MNEVRRTIIYNIKNDIMSEVSLDTKTHQEVVLFIDCQGKLWVISSHNTPSGEICSSSSNCKGNKGITGIEFILNKADCHTYYGYCRICRAPLIAPRTKLQSNG